MRAHRDVWQPRWVVGQRAQPCLDAGVGEHVPAFGDAHIGGYRHNRHAGDQAAGDRQHRRRGRRGQHGDPVRTGDPLGHRRCRADQVATAQHVAVDADRVRDIGGGDDSRIQGGQQHVSEATPAP